MVECWWIVLRNSLGCELNRVCVHKSKGEQALLAAFLKMIVHADLAVGDTYKIEEGETET